MEQLTLRYDASIKDHLLWLLSSLPKGKVEVETPQSKKEKLNMAISATQGVLASKKIDPIAYQKECREER